jgi:hypothetical protein
MKREACCVVRQVNRTSTTQHESKLKFVTTQPRQARHPVFALESLFVSKKSVPDDEFVGKFDKKPGV